MARTESSKSFPRHRELLTLFSDAEFAAMAASRGPFAIRVMLIASWVMLAGATAMVVLLAFVMVRDQRQLGEATIVLAGLIALVLASVAILVRHRRWRRR